MKSRVTVLILGAVLAFQACASVPAHDRAVRLFPAVQKQLALLDDTERRLCNPTAFDADPRADMVTCAGPVAQAIGLTNEKHKQFGAYLLTAFRAQLRLGPVLEQWKPGQPVPAEVNTLEGQIRAAIALARTLTTNDQQKNLLDVADATLSEVLHIVDVVRN